MLSNSKKFDLASWVSVNSLIVLLSIRGYPIDTVFGIIFGVVLGFILIFKKNIIRDNLKISIVNKKEILCSNCVYYVYSLFFFIQKFYSRYLINERK